MLRCRPVLLLMHFAFLLILAGGCITWLTGNPKNIYGIILVFSGFAIYGCSGLLSLVKYFRGRILHTIALLLTAGASFAGAVPAEGAVPVISESRADSLASRQVEFKGRIVPFSTVCSQLTRKLTGSNHVGEADDVQFVASMVIYTEEWMRTPFLKVKGRELRHHLGMKGSHIAPVALYDSVGNYRLAALYSNGEAPLDKEILEVDEKLGLLDELMSGRMFVPLREDDPRKISPMHAGIMKAYDRVQPLRIWFMLALTAGILGLLLPSLFPKKNFRKLFLGLTCATACSGIISYAWLGIYIGRAPLTGHSEIMVFMAMVSGILALMLCMWQRKLKVIWCIAEIMTGGFAMTGWIGLRDVMVSPLMPALESPWLSVHVSVIMTSYALLALTLPAGIALAVGRRREIAPELRNFCFDMLHPGVYLLGIGIITGSIWADTAWGRYWAWDPKETWALITWLLYAIPLHLNILRHNNTKYAISETYTLNIRNAKSNLYLGLYLIIPFLSILMTYFGVALMPSLHSYS